MRLQAALIIVLCLALAIVVFLMVRRAREPKKLFAYQVDSDFDATKAGAALYQPFDELFSTARRIEDATIVLFSDYADIDKNVDRIAYPKRACVYAIGGSDLMASKSKLASMLKEAGGDSYLPATWVLSVEAPSGEGLYMLKKNIQRQEGTKITRDLDYVKRASDDGYVVCQDLLQDPFLIDGRKINLRVYMLVTCFSGKIRMYYYRDGFVYYTAEKFEKNSESIAANVTTGYIDRKVYEKNPLTHGDLYAYLGPSKSERLRVSIDGLFRKLKETYESNLSEKNKGSKHPRFNVFGVDVAPDERLGVKIMEINKAPDLSYKDSRDGAVKLGMVRDMMGLVGVLAPCAGDCGFAEVA